jgi:hypothetical protein
MKKMTKIGLVLAGYILALAGAFLAAYLDDLMTAQFQAQSPGMVAGGEMILFIAVFAFLSVFPTALVLFSLRSVENFWNIFSVLGLGLALTGPPAECFMIAVRTFTFWPHNGWAIFIFIAMLRVFGSVILGFGFLFFAFITQYKRPRRWLLIAAGIDIGLFMYMALRFTFWNGFY